MAVEVILSDGSRRNINGRNGKIIEWLVIHHDVLSERERFEIEIHCAGQHVTIAPKLIENLSPAKD